MSAARREAGAPSLAPEVRGAAAVAETFKGRAQAAQPALVGGLPGLVLAPGGEPRVAFEFRMRNGRIVGINLIADRERHRELDLVILSEPGR
jgi:RNA polymerase sigma-70 factor (ECF subfamily)